MSNLNQEINQNGGVAEGEQPFECVPGANLYIKHLDDHDDEWLRKTFSKYGAITSAKIMCYEGGASKGFGFVCFSTAEEAAVAKNEMNGKLLPDNTRPLYVNIAQKREDRRAFLSAQYSSNYQQNYQGWRNGDPVPQADRWMSVQNGRPPQESTPPRTHSSPLQVPSSILPIQAKPNHHLSNHRAALPIAAAAAPSIPLAGVPTQQVAGMNGFVMMGPPLRQQPLAATAATPRPNFYLNPSASTVPQPAAVQRIQYAQVGTPWQYPVNSRQPGQTTYAMRPTHTVHMAAGTPAPATQFVVNTMGAKIPHIHLHQQGQGVNVMHVPFPYAVAQPAPIQQVRPVGVATYPGQSHHSVWSNGMP